MRVALAFVFCTALLAGVAGWRAVAQESQLREGETLEETELAYPYMGPLDDDWNELWWCVRIVDAYTREPIAGARVSVPEHPGSGVPEEERSHLCTGIADDDGWVRLPWNLVRCWRDYVIADAAGYAAEEYCGPGSDECALVPAVDVPFVLLDVFEEPIASAPVALNRCCGHVPDQRVTATDVRGHGVFRDVDPECHRDIDVSAPGARRVTWLERTWRTGDPPVPVHALPGIVVTGRVTLADGSPLVRAYIGGAEVQQPWTRTDREGRFRLVGLKTWAKIDVYPLPWSEETRRTFTAPPAGVELSLVLDDPAPPVPVRVEVEDKDGQPADGVRVVAVRTDGLTVTALSDGEGRAECALVPGAYRLIADGELGRWGRTEAPLTVAKGGPREFKVTVSRNPTVLVDAAAILELPSDAGLKVALVSRSALRQLDVEQLHGSRIPIPPDPAIVFIAANDPETTWVDDARERQVRTIRLPHPESVDESTTIVLAPFAATRVHARLVGPDGSPVPGALTVRRDRWSTTDAMVKAVVDGNPAPATTTRRVGTLAWVATPEDGTLLPASGDFRISERGGSVDLGTIRLHPRPETMLRIVVPPRALAATEDAVVRIRRPRANRTVDGSVAPDGVVSVDLPWSGGDEDLWLSMPGWPVLPLKQRVSGPPPWTLVWPTASLRFDVTDADGKPLEEAAVIVDGHVFDGEFEDSPSFTVHGVAAGPLMVVVGEPEHTPQVLRLLVRDGEQRSFTIRLKPRGQ